MRGPLHISIKISQSLQQAPCKPRQNVLGQLCRREQLWCRKEQPQRHGTPKSKGMAMDAGLKTWDFGFPSDYKPFWKTHMDMVKFPMKNKLKLAFTTRVSASPNSSVGMIPLHTPQLCQTENTLFMMGPNHGRLGCATCCSPGLAC